MLLLTYTLECVYGRDKHLYAKKQQEMKRSNELKVCVYCSYWSAPANSDVYARQGDVNDIKVLYSWSALIFMWVVLDFKSSPIQSALETLWD